MPPERKPAKKLLSMGIKLRLRECVSERNMGYPTHDPIMDDIDPDPLPSSERNSESFFIHVLLFLYAIALYWCC